jgi:hypothetical protein
MNALSPTQVYELAEALASALLMVAEAVPGSDQQTQAITQARDLYLRLGVPLLTETERSGFPAADLTHKE